VANDVEAASTALCIPLPISLPCTDSASAC